MVTNHPEDFCFLSDQKLKVVCRKKGSFGSLEEAWRIVAQFEQYAIKN